jgi:DNA-binding NarL/FixJ family response regulator
VAHGQTNKQIGHALHISEATVKTHLRHIFRKLNAPDRASAVAAAIKRRILSPDDAP